MMMEQPNLLLAFLMTAILGAQAQLTPCSIVNRAANMDACLSAIRSRAVDKTNGPYGTAYFERCPMEDRDNINCMNNLISEPKSLSELSFKVANQDLSTIDRFLAMQYTSHAGEYTGCDHVHSYPNEKSFFIDPLSDAVFPSWDLRDNPVSTWDFVEGELFLLITMNPAVYTQSVVINIEGNDFTNATLLNQYFGVRNPLNAPMPFTFTVYKQPNRFTPQSVSLQFFNLTAFAERYQLQGPVAFSWVMASYDAYTVGFYTYRGQNCASLVEDAIRPYLPRFDFMPSPDEVNLRVFMHVEFTTGPITFNCGNYSVTRPAHTVVLDPLTPNALIDTADLRTDSLQTVHFEMKKIESRLSDFSGKLYTLLRLDPETKRVYGMLVNLPGDDFTARGVEPDAGDIILTYEPPTQPNDGNQHPLMFLLYEQSALLPANLNLTPYLVPCDDDRHFDDLAGFIADHQLDLVGTSLMHVEYDEYTRCTTTQG